MFSERGRRPAPEEFGAAPSHGQASITDAQIVKLCEGIVRSQRSEIERMQAILARYGRRGRGRSTV
jgi:hypothetical protein